jgi:eukaryotic-like serine/threonine-protein kinase
MYAPFEWLYRTPLPVLFGMGRAGDAGLDVDIGKVIAGKYELVRLIGKGAMGEVWLAKHNTLGGEFAIKLVEPADDIEAETAAGRFQLEAQIAAKLSRRTRHIVSVSDHGEEHGLAYLVMELLEGESLEARVARQKRLDLPEIAAIVSQVSRALSLAHEEGVFHRDLKPANVWLGKDEDGRLVVKLLDFGIARAKVFKTQSPFVTSKDMVLGTPSYMSPEQARGLDTLDHRCDLWALSVVAYEAMTATIPFEGETVEDIFLSICTFRVVPITSRRPELAPAVDAYFSRAFAPKIEERYANAAELAVAFESLITPEELDAALGFPAASSARRLEAARRSDPALASSPNIAATVRIPTPAGPFQPVNAGAPESARQVSSPDLDPVALGDPGMPRKSGSSTWLLALAGVLAAALVATLLVVTLRSSKPANAMSGDAPPPTVSSLVAATPPSTPTAPTIVIGADSESASPPVLTTTLRGRPHVPAAERSHDRPTAVPPPPAPAPAPAPTPAPATTKSARNIQKSDVF